MRTLLIQNISYKKTDRKAMKSETKFFHCENPMLKPSETYAMH